MRGLSIMGLMLTGLITSSCGDVGFGLTPPADEICDQIDNDLDGEIDEGLDLPWYQDWDNDGYGSSEDPTLSCEQPPDRVADDTDCDDANPDVNPGAPEICDGLDNDCDEIDDGSDEDLALFTWYEDADGDGYGLNAVTVIWCDRPSGYADQGGECDDGNPLVFPAADERCNDVDDDCDAAIDEDPIDPLTFYLDSDGDGYGDERSTAIGCEAPPGYIEQAGDCDDSSPANFPGAPEICDGEDNDCDDVADDGLSRAAYYRDADGDGFGTLADVIFHCELPAGYAPIADDCDDTDGDVNPLSVEIPYDGIDNDCNLLTVDDDLDRDGYAIVDDCDDTDPFMNPGMNEVCDGVDNNCDGVIDRVTSLVVVTLPDLLDLCGRHVPPSDCEFAGNGPYFSMDATLRVGPTELDVDVAFNAIETNWDLTEVDYASTFSGLYVAPPGFEIRGVLSGLSSSCSYTDTDHEQDLCWPTSGPVYYFLARGDTPGDDACNCAVDDTKLTVVFAPLTVELECL